MIGNVAQNFAPPLFSLTDSRTIIPISEECLGREWVAIDSNPASGTFTANLVVYVPLVTVERLLVRQFFWLNGAAVDGNTDVGIYSADGSVLLGSAGSTLNAGISALQAVNVADFLLPANSRLWLALSSDSSVQTYLRAAPAVVYYLDYVGVKQQAAGWSSGLPSSATLAVPSVAVLPMFGFTGSAVI